MPAKGQKRSSLPRAEAVRDDILACEQELKKLKRLYKLLLELESPELYKARPKPAPAPIRTPVPTESDFYQGAPVGVPVANDDDED